MNKHMNMHINNDNHIHIKINARSDGGARAITREMSVHDAKRQYTAPVSYHFW